MMLDMASFSLKLDQDSIQLTKKFIEPGSSMKFLFESNQVSYSDQRLTKIKELVDSLFTNNLDEEVLKEYIQELLKSETASSISEWFQSLYTLAINKKSSKTYTIPRKDTILEIFKIFNMNLKFKNNEILCKS